MTGTERASARLALGVLRLAILTHPRTDYAYHSIVDAAASRDAAGSGDAVYAAHTVRPVSRQRYVRARWALYLRAVLRAESGPIRSNGQHAWEDAGNGADSWCPTCDRLHGLFCATPPCTHRLARPLWTSAPSKEPPR